MDVIGSASAPKPKAGFRLRVSYGTRLLALIWSAAGWMVVAWAAILLLQGLIPVAIVWLTKPLVNSVQAAVGAGVNRETIEPVLTTALALGSLMLAAELLKIALQWISMSQAELVQDHLSDMLHAKATELDMAFFESPAFHDRLFRVHEAGGRSLSLLDSFGGLAQNLVTVVGIGALLLSYGVWIALVLLLGTVPALLVVMRGSRQQHEWWKKVTADQRRTGYFGQLLTSAPHAAEVRVFGLADHFRRLFRELRRRLRAERMRLYRRQSIARLGAETIAMISSAGAIAWMVWRAILGRATLGDIALFTQAFQRGQGLVRSLLMNIGQIHSSGLFLESLFDYLDLQPIIVAPPDPVPVPKSRPSSIRFRDVSFRYPGSERLALENFNLSIPAGKTIAIVGSNGAGKSTLLKLLCRFYDPLSGHVELDGIDLRRFDPVELRRSMTVMFQVPLSFQGTVRENITLSDLSRSDVAGDVESAAQDAGLTDLVTRLPAGYETTLGKAFTGGTELSGGEWQRLALARSYFRRSGLIVLDEPTSSMDSWSEAQWFERFRHLATGATAVIITHRLTIARRAHEIHVMEGGTIVESGSHDALLSSGGRYADSWADQVQGGIVRQLD